MAQSLGVPAADETLAQAQSSLESTMRSSGKTGAGLAEALALNEFAAHARVQRAGDVEKTGVTRM